MTQVEKGTYTHRGWTILRDGKLWLLWPPGASDGTRYTKAVSTLARAKEYIRQKGSR